jgi:hypothetical protein
VLLEPSAVALFFVATQTKNALPTVMAAVGLAPSVEPLAVAEPDPRAVTAENAIYTWSGGVMPAAT